MAVKDVLLTLGGQERRLRCDLAAWAAVEDKGYELMSLVKSLEQRTAFKSLLVLLWAMLGGNDGPPIAEVGHWVDGDNFGLVAQKIGEALRDAFPPGDEAANPPSPSGGTGTERSGSAPISDSSPISSGG